MELNKFEKNEFNSPYLYKLHVDADTSYISN